MDSAIDEINRAMDDLHIVNGKPMHIRFITRSHFAPVSLDRSLPGNVTEETLGQEFFKYGKSIYRELKNDQVLV
ncbi:hypothetical protein Ddc_16630 [Ditylenchus destructor]|nr:hypothetical protein Ddc_16630 [Ditylenchus destructor]